MDVDEARFCVECGTALERREAFGRERLACPGCGHVHFDDPKVAVGVVIEDKGKIILARRGHEPNIGGWSFPSGYVDAGEELEKAAVREVEEETGLTVRIDRLLGAYSQPGNRTIFIAYAGAVVSGEIVTGEECLEVRAFAPDRLPQLAFPHDDEVLRAWGSGRTTAGD